MIDTALIASARLASTAAALSANELDLLEYIRRVCDRLDAVDGQIHAFLPEPDRRARLIRDAQALLERYPSPENRPPLYGIPIGVKDMFRVEGFPTRAGSQLPAELFDGAEAASVTRLKQAGAIILGKTVTTEFAYFEPGATRNPFNLEHTPGGSSSGSAAAVAAGLSPLTLGTQTIASTIRPAAFCSIVGFKPSYNRIDKTGVIDLAPSFDHVGLFTQDVEGMTLAASVLINDWQSVQTERPPGLGIPVGPYLQQASPEGLEAFEKQVSRLEDAGYTLKRIPALDNTAEINEDHKALMAGEMAQVHREWFARYESLYRPRTAEMIRKGQTVSTETMVVIRQKQLKLRVELEAQMRQEAIDLWISPSAKGPAPRGLNITGDPVMSFPWTFAGLPTVSLPTKDTVGGLPLGLQCIAPFGQDELLLVWAQSIAELI